ncbi:ThiF family adenylyltransferase [Sinomonas sp. JGH33]|uniref:ThiF family adenylyltransferase n=1 Tax=Sinomonas terricola TaxID=3110330 RepID=A0ABU5T346_9MICC|nr:ThiF family adenylyltransferase [Sinomonas sp. JGH33]MEA5454075.1 ThiF family adenylyltransferase [Sinomonas sp. JGH33]
MTARPWRPRFRDGVLIFSGPSRLRFVNLGDLVVKEFSVEPWVTQLVPLLDGSRGLAQIESELSGSGSGTEVSPENVAALVGQLEREGLLAHRGALVGPVEWSPCARQLQFFDELISREPGIGNSAAELQERLERAHVLVVGVGGVGTHVLESLARAGVGSIELFDDDTVDVTNLHRQVLFGPEDLGRPKVIAAQERIGELNPSGTVHARCERFTTSSVLRSRELDLVINCADEPDVLVQSDRVASWAQERSVPHIVGGAYGANLGVVGLTVLPGKTVCWACARADAADISPGRGLVRLKGRSGTTGTVGPITAMVADVMGWDALRVLLGARPVLANAVRELDLHTLEWRVRGIAPQAACPDCAPLRG